MNPEDQKKAPSEAAEKRKQDLDDFWDVERLLPDKPKAPKYTPTATRKIPEAVELDVPPPKSTASPTIRTVTVPPTGSSPLPFSHEEITVLPTNQPTHSTKAESCELCPPPKKEDRLLGEYSPDSHLLHSVCIYEWASNYHYFDSFIKDARAYEKLGGREVPHKSFFSYFPQYAQLNRSQRAWYLYWRDEVRNGRYPQTDYAYILLYLFELINLEAEGETAECHRDLMAKVWINYRKAYPQLDHYVCEWLCDYCLIHQLPAPVLHLVPALGQIIATARLKEFYLSAMISVGDEQVNIASARILLAHSCQYDYRKSKFYSGEHKELFDSVIPAAVAAIFPMLLQKGHGETAPSGSVMQDSKVSRDAYVGALCAYSNKRKLEVSYTSFSRSHDLRFLVGDMVRHIENRIRASILIRSRLTVNFLTVPLRKALDAWLDLHLPSPETALRRAEMKQPRPEYEALYDLPHTEVSIESADAIEQSSWETTKILVEAFADENDEPLFTEAIPQEAPLSPENTEPVPLSDSLPANESDPVADHPLLCALGDRVNFLRAVLKDDRAGQKDYCATHKKLPDAVVDEINDLSVENEIYDMIIEENGLGAYRIIEDYRDMVEEMLLI